MMFRDCAVPYDLRCQAARAELLDAVRHVSGGWSRSEWGGRATFIEPGARRLVS
jgi:hypothetical protein